MARSRTKTSRPLLKLITTAALVGLIIIIYLDARITTTFTDKMWELPAKVYARPLELFNGARLDADGDIYIADLEAAGVDHCWAGDRSDGTTGKCLVLITPDAERSMNTYLAISETLSDEQLDPAALADSEYLYIEGYLVTSPTGLAAAVKARKMAEEAGVKTALSFSDPGMVEFFREGMAEIVGDGLDLVFCNEAEALGWGQTESLDEAIEALKKVAKQFVITLGGEGALTYDGETLSRIPVHQVQAVDSNGAGDMYAGAFLYAINRGEDFPTAGRFASLAAGKIVANYGPRLSNEAYPALRAEFFGD